MILRSPRPVVLMYHAFGRRRRDPYSLFVPAEDFERQLRILSRYWRPLDLTSYLWGLGSGRWPSRSVLVTIDDGYASVLEHAAPLLARYGVPAVLLVCPGRLGGSSSWMQEMPGEAILDPDQLRELPGYGLEIGAHGMDHERLPGLSEEELQRQVTEGRRALADTVGTLPRAFAYPEGLFDAAAIRAVREAGYDVAFSVHEGHGRFAVPRRPITSRDTFPMFLLKILPGYDVLEGLTDRQRWVRRFVARVLGQRSLED